MFCPLRIRDTPLRFAPRHADARQREQQTIKVLINPYSPPELQKNTPTTPYCVTTVTHSAQLESVIPQRAITSSELLSILAGSPHPEGATVPTQLKSMFESDTYYHPRLDLWPKVLLRWATALTEYPQSWTCLNIRHVDSLWQGGILFLLRHHSYRVGSGLCITPIQTLAETPYCLNKWVSLAFICPSFWGGPARST